MTFPSPVILVTGVSRGLGHALFDKLLHASLRPAGIGRRFDRAHVAAMLRGDCHLITFDLADAAGLDRIDLRRIIAADARSVVFIANAAVVEPIGTLQGLDAAAAARAFTINALAPALLAARLAQLCGHRGLPLHILDISTGAAIRALPGLAAYCGSKGAARIMLDCVACEHSMVTVEHVDPGVIDTGMQAILRGASQEGLPSRETFQRLLTDGVLRSAHDVAEEILARANLA